MIKKVETYKFGPFYFSDYYNRTRLEKLLIRAKTLFLTVCNIPVLPDIAAKLEDDIIRKSFFGTAAIEGNPLSWEEIDAVLDYSDTARILKRSEKQILNLKNAYDLIKKMDLNKQ